MRRRDFIGMAMGAVAWPRPAWTQHARKIGILNLREGGTTVTAMRPAWQRLGLVEGQSVLLRAAHGEGGRFPQLIAELMNEGIGVLIAVGAQAVRIASQTTGVVPIVAIDLETDPVRAGFARSIARPGGNISRAAIMSICYHVGRWGVSANGAASAA
jgi:ABC-type uncharacterized transport system substrate-binding protein